MAKKKIKVLLTGSNGFLGRHVKYSLLKQNYILNCLVRQHNISTKPVNYIKFDIDDKNSIDYAVRNSDYIIHMAAITKSNDKDIYKVNVGYTKLLVEYAKKYNIKNFIFISSSNVSADFKDHYTISKKKAENIVKTLKNYVILRPTILYGLGDNRYITRFIKLIKRFHIVPLINDEDQVLYPLYVKDLVFIINNFISSKKYCSIYTILGDKINYKNLALLISKKLNVKIFFFPISIFFIKFLINTQSFFMKPFLTHSQVNNLISSKEFKCDNIFKFNLTNIEEGINIMLKK